MGKRRIIQEAARGQRFGYNRMQPERMMGKGLAMEAMEGRNIWRVARTVFFGNLLTGVVSNLVFVVFFSRLGGWDGMFGFFLTILLPWSLLGALVAAAVAAWAARLMGERPWPPRWPRRLFAASLLWGLTSCVAVITLIPSWVLVWPCSMLLTYFCLWPPKGFGKAA